MSSSQTSGRQKVKPKPKATQRPLVSQISGFDDKPLWNHVKVLNVEGGGGNRKWTCNYCNKIVNGSYTKVKGHLLRLPNHGVEGCLTLTDDVFEAIKKEHAGAEARKAEQELQARKKAEYISLPEGSDLTQQKKRKGMAPSSALPDAFNIAQRDVADKEAARMFYACGLPFNFARSPYFRKYSLTLANSKLAGYTPPSYNRLRTTLLSQEKTHINRLLQPFKDTWRKKGLSLCSDGWSDIQRRPLINIMAASQSGAMFVKAIDASGNIKDADYVASLFIEAINIVGEKNVVQIVTDNATNYKAAGLSIETKYPHIFWTPCVVHSINLALKSICDPGERSPQYAQCKWISDLIAQVNDIRNFVLNHSMANFIFNLYSDLKLLSVAETRFASSIIMAKRIMVVKESLEKMVIDPNWRTYRADGTSTAETRARDVKKIIVDDTFWDGLGYLLKFTEPIVDMLRIADMDCAVLHLVYDMWDTMIENVKKIIFEHEERDLLVGRSDFFDAIHEILESRWNKSNTPLHCMAHSLVPKYYSDAWLQSGNGVPRISPNEDQEVAMNRRKCLKRLFPNPADFTKVSLEYGAFSSGSGDFEEAHVIAARNFEDPLSWWANHGSSTPLLRDLAFKLLSQPASSSCCERNWSTYAMIQNVKRNRLATNRAEDLVFVHSNIRLLSRKSKEYKQGPSKYWDIGGDQFDIEGREVIQLAQLSLDEPDLEGVTFDEEDDDDVEVLDADY